MIIGHCQDVIRGKILGGRLCGLCGVEAAESLLEKQRTGLTRIIRGRQGACSRSEFRRTNRTLRVFAHNRRRVRELPES
jgi:hypothetical protein